MKLMKQKLLLHLTYGVDFFKPVAEFDYMTYKQLYWRLGNYRQVSVRSAVNGLIIKGLVARMVRGKMVFVRLTKTGRDMLKRQYPGADRVGRKWDNSWRVVVGIGVRKVKSDKMRVLRKPEFGFRHPRFSQTQWRALGFVNLARGVYVSPFAADSRASDFLAKKFGEGGVVVMETRRFVVGDDRDFAMRVWRLDTIYKKYQNVGSQLERVLYEARRSKGLTDQLKDGYKKVFNDWFEVLKMEPGLPKQLLPSDWPHLEERKALEKVGVAVKELETEA